MSNKSRISEIKFREKQMFQEEYDPWNWDFNSRANKRAWNKEFKKITIKDKFWWNTLSLAEKVSCYNLFRDGENESDIRKKYQGNLIQIRDSKLKEI